MVWFVAAAMAATAVDRSLEAPGALTLTVELHCGAVRVVGSDRAGVRISGTVPDADRLRSTSSSGRITVDLSEIEAEDGCVDLLFEVPAAATLDLDGISTSISLTGLTGEVELESISGAVTVAGAPRSLEVETVSGAVQVTGPAQRIEIESVSGSVSVEGAGGSVTIESVSGTIAVVGGSPLANVDLGTISGSVAFTGALARAGRLEAESHSGSMRIRLPADTDATLSQSTFSGRIRNAFGQGGDLVLGSGAGRIELGTFSGEVDVERQ